MEEALFQVAQYQFEEEVLESVRQREVNENTAGNGGEKW